MIDYIRMTGPKSDIFKQGFSDAVNTLREQDRLFEQWLKSDVRLRGEQPSIQFPESPYLEGSVEHDAYVFGRSEGNRFYLVETRSYAFNHHRETFGYKPFLKGFKGRDYEADL